MTIQEAIEILRIHNEWRRSVPDVQPYSPSVIGQAIDVVVAHCRTDFDNPKKNNIAGLFSEAHGFTDDDFDYDPNNKEQQP